MRRALLAMTAISTLIAVSGCSDNKATVGASSDGSQTFKVLVDGHTADNGAAFLAYFPNELSAHPGDTVVFHSAYSGEPHSVAFGTAVNTALDKVDALLKVNPKAFDDGPPPAELTRIPGLLPDGPGDAIQAGAQPCVIDTGALPTKDACANQTLSELTGAQELAASGWMGVDEDWTVKLSPSIAPGKYRFMCQLHGPSMTGALTVAPKETTIKDAAAVEAEGVAAREAVLAKMKAGQDLLDGATAAKAFAGAGVPTVEEAFFTKFAPSEIKIPVGATVSWNVVGPHSIALNTPAEAQSLRVQGEGTAVHLNQKAVTPAGGPGPDPAAKEPETMIDGKSWDGVGFRNSGIIFGFGPTPTVFKLTFSKAGTYALLCTIHEDMKGTVTVT